MMGNKKLSTIRQELKTALQSTGKDPIAWLEECITAAKQKGESSAVVESLKRVLEGAKKRGRGRRQSAKK